MTIEQLERPSTTLIDPTLSTLRIKISHAVGRVINPPPLQPSTGSPLHRERKAVQVARGILTESGFVNRNDLIGSFVLQPHRLPGARTSIWGAPTNRTHQGLASAYGGLKNMLLQKTPRRPVLAPIPVQEAVTRYCRIIDRLPDASEIDRRVIVLHSLTTLGLDATLTTTLSNDGHYVADVNGREIELPFTADLPDRPPVWEWASPYVGLDFSDPGH